MRELLSKLSSHASSPRNTVIHPGLDVVGPNADATSEVPVKVDLAHHCEMRPVSDHLVGVMGRQAISSISPDSLEYEHLC
jgi:hypothetical protein